MSKRCCDWRQSRRAGARANYFSRFHEQTGAGYTRFHEILNKLDAIRLINADFSGAGERGTKPRHQRAL